MLFVVGTLSLSRFPPPPPLVILQLSDSLSPLLHTALGGQDGPSIAMAVRC